MASKFESHSLLQQAIERRIQLLREELEHWVEERRKLKLTDPNGEKFGKGMRRDGKWSR